MTITEIERYICKQDTRHPLYGYVPTIKHLKSRHSFVNSKNGNCLIIKQERQNMWNEKINHKPLNQFGHERQKAYH